MRVSLSSDGRKSERVASLSSEAAGLRSEFFKPSGKPSTSRTPTSGKVRRAAPYAHHARFLLSRSVVHFVPDTSSEGERKGETASSVPLRAQTRTAESLRNAPLPVVPGLDAPGTSVRPLSLPHPSLFRRPGPHVRRWLTLCFHSWFCARAGKTVNSRSNLCVSGS